MGLSIFGKILNFICCCYFLFGFGVADSNSTTGYRYNGKMIKWSGKIEENMLLGDVFNTWIHI